MAQKYGGCTEIAWLSSPAATISHDAYLANMDDLYG
jgi:hypothetical protein